MAANELAARLMEVRDPDEAKALVVEAEAWVRDHPEDYAVLTALEQAQRMASVGTTKDL